MHCLDLRNEAEVGAKGTGWLRVVEVDQTVGSLARSRVDRETDVGLPLLHLLLARPACRMDGCCCHIPERDGPRQGRRGDSKGPKIAMEGCLNCRCHIMAHE